MTADLCIFFYNYVPLYATQVLLFSRVIYFTFFPGSTDSDKAANAKKNKGADRASYENSHFAADDDDNIVFEDFARLRLNEPDE